GAGGGATQTVRERRKTRNAESGRSRRFLVTRRSGWLDTGPGSSPRRTRTSNKPVNRRAPRRGFGNGNNTPHRSYVSEGAWSIPALGGARHQVRRFIWLFGRVCDRGGAAAAEGGVSVLSALAPSRLRAEVER